MNKLIILSSIPVILIGLAACSSESDNSDTKTQNKVQGEPSPETELTPQKGPNGKWLANPETHQAIDSMKVLMGAHDIEADSVAYLRLNKKMSNQFVYIYQNCTMKGEAHDSLHAFLKPLNYHIQHLIDWDTASKHNSFMKVNDILAVFDEKFE